MNSQYKYLQEKGENNNPHCQLECDQDYDRYIMPNYICSKNCKEPNNFVVRNNNNLIECQSKCPSKGQYAQYDQEKKEYYCTTEECHENSEYKYYYLEDKICLKECKEYTKEGTNICLSSCLTANLFYDDDNSKCVSDCRNLGSKHFAKINGHCDLKCEDDEYYNEDDLICRVKCTTDKKIDDHICRLNCSTSTINKLGEIGSEAMVHKICEFTFLICSKNVKIQKLDIFIIISILVINVKIIVQINILKEILVSLHAMNQK